MFVDIVRQIIVEHISLKHIAMVFNLNKKDPTTRYVLKTKVSIKSF